MKLFFINFNNIFNDAPQPWQLGFQDSAAPGYTGLVTLHNTIGFYLIVISFAVFWVIFSIIFNYNSKRNPIAHKYLTHGTALELIWTISPALILIAIAFPSFRLLYLMDSPIFELKFLNLFPEGFTVLTSYVLLNSTFIQSRNQQTLAKLETSLNITISENISSTIGTHYNKYMRESSIFSRHIISQLVGHLLGDGSLVVSRTSITPYFVFTQTLKRFDYVWFVFQQLSYYCSKAPRLNISTRKGKYYFSIQVLTRSYPKMLELYKLFYNLNNKPVKTVKVDLLLYLDSIALAYWAMVDGAKTTSNSGFYLHTKGFTFPEVFLLVGMLHYQFGLNCSVQNHEEKPVIYIKADSMNKFREIVQPHFHPSMLYKFKKI